MEKRLNLGNRGEPLSLVSVPAPTWRHRPNLARSQEERAFCCLAHDIKRHCLDAGLLSKEKALAGDIMPMFASDDEEDELEVVTLEDLPTDCGS